MKSENIKISSEIIDKIHACGQEILDAFVRICEQNNLRYYLIAGTLLGAIRHKGPIPWDDDVDVCMPRKDFEEFRKIMLARPEGELYHIHCRENDPNYPHILIHLMKKGTLYRRQSAVNRNARFMGIWLDIFPLDDAPDQFDIRYRLHGWKIRKLKAARYIKATINKESLSMKQRLLQAMLYPISFKRLCDYEEKQLRKYNDCGYNQYVSWGSKYGYVKQTMPKAWYGTPVKVLYNGSLYDAPHEWDKILTRLYGDYMKLPPQNEQTGHGALEIKV